MRAIPRPLQSGPSPEMFQGQTGDLAYDPNTFLRIAAAINIKPVPNNPTSPVPEPLAAWCPDECPPCDPWAIDPYTHR